jgi:hypothetical protein
MSYAWRYMLKHGALFNWTVTCVHFLCVNFTASADMPVCVPGPYVM